VARQVLAGASPSRAVWASARIRSTPPRHSRARASATQLSTVLPSGSFPSARARSAAAAHRSAARPSTLAELAHRYGIPLPSMTSFGSFAVFVGTYTAACQVLRSEDDLRWLVREVVEDAVLAGAMWVEPSLGPANHRGRLGADRDVVALVLEEGRRAAQQLDVGFGLMIAAARDRGVAEAVAAARLAADFADSGVVSFGLDADEAAFPPEPFEPAFGLAAQAGLICAPHAGEFAGPAGVRAGIEVLHARRILHGGRGPELLREVAARGVCFDVCLTSNVKLGVVPTLEQHPLPALLAAGVPCSLGADDPLLFGASLLDEYDHARTMLGLDDAQLAEIARASLRSGGAPSAVRERALAGVDGWLATSP
jgi:adenosine deaminase